MIQKEDSFTDIDLKWERQFPNPSSEQEAIEDDIAHYQRIGQYVKNPPRTGYNRKLLKEHTSVRFAAICAFNGHSRCLFCHLNCKDQYSIANKLVSMLDNQVFNPTEFLLTIIKLIKDLKEKLKKSKN